MQSGRNSEVCGGGETRPQAIKYLVGQKKVVSASLAIDQGYLCRSGGSAVGLDSLDSHGFV